MNTREPVMSYKTEQELKNLSNAELADLIESRTYDDDGFSTAARVALVRVLRSTGTILGRSSFD